MLITYLAWLKPDYPAGDYYRANALCRDFDCCTVYAPDGTEIQSPFLVCHAANPVIQLCIVVQSPAGIAVDIIGCAVSFIPEGLPMCVTSKPSLLSARFAELTC